MNIYFCGSIRGGRGDAGVYRRMISRLKNHGEVLTEHVGDTSLTEFGGDGTNEGIYKRDTAWLQQCDIIVAECTTPSLGVGYELAYGEALGKSVYIFFDEDSDVRRLSAMLAGNPKFHIQTYLGEDDLMEKIDALFS